MTVKFSVRMMFGQARPTFAYCRLRKRNPRDGRIFRFGPLQVRW